MYVEDEVYEQMVRTIKVAQSFMTDVSKFLLTNHPDMLDESGKILVNKIILEDQWRRDNER